MVRRTLVLLASLPVAIALSGCTKAAEAPASAPAAGETASTPAPLTGQAQIERGRMLVIGGGCHDCHTPKKIGPNGPEADLDRSLAGHPESVGVLPHFEDAKGSK